jgi:hypothetical protein
VTTKSEARVNLEKIRRGSWDAKVGTTIFVLPGSSTTVFDSVFFN